MADLILELKLSEQNVDNVVGDGAGLFKELSEDVGEEEGHVFGRVGAGQG